MLAWLMGISTNVKNALNPTTMDIGHKTLSTTDSMIEIAQCARIESPTVSNTIRQNEAKKSGRKHLQIQKTEDQSNTELVSYLTMQSEMGEFYARLSAHVDRPAE